MVLRFIKVGKWLVVGGTYDGALAVRVNTRPVVWELQDEFGSLIVNDGFESLSNVQAWLNICDE